MTENDEPQLIRFDSDELDSPPDTAAELALAEEAFERLDQPPPRIDGSAHQAVNRASTPQPAESGVKPAMDAEPPRAPAPTRPAPAAGGRVLHVMVVGFHHKKGCQIDYCYPPMRWHQPTSAEVSPSADAVATDGVDQPDAAEKIETAGAGLPEPEGRPGELGDCGQLPPLWRTLPSVALPDGAHNFDRDTIYFHLPHPSRPERTVYGISCYRQMPADRLKQRPDEVTRTTVQKSVVVLSELPLYGLIAVKCEMITHAYFGECDFSQVACLRELYANLNGLLGEQLLATSEVFLGLSPRDLVLSFSHKVLVLFKLVLLEKKVN